MSEVILDVSEDGDIKVEVKGLKGSKCILETESLLNSLGNIKDVTSTKEFSERPEEVRSNATGRINNRSGR